MYEIFKATFFLDEVPPETRTTLKVSFEEARLDELFTHFGGKSFNKSLYRVVSPKDVSFWNNIVTVAFPNFADRITCFAVDWLGRIFALDSSRLVGNSPGVIMLEPGTAEALEIPCNIESFHETELIQYQEEALAVSFFHQWLSSGGSSPNLKQCIGYKTPLFMGGSDTVDNLEVVDLDVYWTISAKLIEKIRGLPKGTSLNHITIS